MKFLLNELNKYVKISDKSKSELIDIFNNLAFEVESIYPASKAKGLKLKLVQNCQKHPNADSLNYLNTEINGKLIDVVCGASNIKTGQIVAHAVPGSIINEIEMKQKNLRGINSNGMIVSISEIMGIDKNIVEEPERENIVVFPKGTDLNSDPIKILELDGDIVDLSILPDRQYAMSYFLMAREIAAYLNRDFNWKIEDVKRTGSIDVDINLKDNAEAIFVTNVVLNENIETPMWMKRILYTAGIKPSNNIEDVVKYTMLLTGSVTYIVDKNSKYELNGKMLNKINIFESRSLLTNNLNVAFVTIASNKKGNFLSEKNVDKIFGARSLKGSNIESANLTSKFILEVAKKAGFLKEASPTLSKLKNNEIEIEINDDYIFNYLGSKIDLEKIAQKLKIVGIIKKKNKYLIPSYRNDISSKADVIEEIARFWGINNIVAAEYKISNDNISENKIKNALIKITDEFVNFGLSEIKTYQLVTENQAKEYDIWNIGDYVRLTSDYSLEFNTLQPSLLCGLIESFKLNHKKDKSDIRLFEIGNIFHKEKHIYTLGIIHDEKINEPESILATKELVLKALESINIDLKKINFKNTENKLLNPYISSDILYENQKIGIIGEIHPSILRKNKFIRLDKIKVKLYYAELQIEKLL